jgi:hypothetical protein
MAETSHCFTMAGSDSCPTSFDRKYRGYYFGGHYTHAGGGHRICVEDGVQGSGRQNSGDYIYVTSIHDGEVGGYPSTKAVKCAVCCRQDGF